jgi:phosphate transport system permease protein
MSPATFERTPRLSVSARWELWRRCCDGGFRLVGFSATFFGLAILAIFLAALVLDTCRWFQAMPPLIEARNAYLKARAEQSPDDIFEQLMLDVDRQWKDELARARTEKARAEVNAVFETIVIPRQRALAEERWADYQREAETGIRPDVSPLALAWHFLSHGPSHEPQDAAVLPAMLGSLWLVGITVLMAVPLGVGAAVYLEEYRSSNRWARLLSHVIAINISNLAGVPSVVFGILGAYLFVELIFKPLEARLPWIAARNVLGGGMTLALLTLPYVIVAAQEAIRTVPVSIRHGAYALGATRWQVIRDHVIPGAAPGILTGTILAMCRAIGEAAPLVLFGALVFVSHNPGLFTRFTAMPLQIFGWVDQPDLVWRYNAAVACVVLLVMLLALNGLAIYLRQRGQRHTRW